VRALDQRIASVTREVGIAARDDKARRLMTVPGIGPLVATAVLAAAGNGQQLLGLGLFPSSTLPAASRYFSASAGVAIGICGAC